MPTAPMKVSRDQVRFLQMARRCVERLSNGSYDEAAYRMALHNLAGVQSSKDLTQVGFESMMAHFESMGWRDNQRLDTYWRDLDAHRNIRASARQAREIRELAATQTKYPLKALCLRFSDARAEVPERLSPQEASKLIEGLKAISKRSGGAG